jgi:hypothetical protein
MSVIAKRIKPIAAANPNEPLVKASWYNANSNVVVAYPGPPEVIT